MASLVKIGDWYSARYKGTDGKEKKLALGVSDEKRANAMLVHVSELAEALRTDSRPIRSTLEWVAKQDEQLQIRLEKAGFIQLRNGSKKDRATLGPFLDSYVKTRSDVKGATAIVYGHTVRNLKTYFGEDKPLREITPGDADEFRLWLLSAESVRHEVSGRMVNGQGLADNTARRRCTLAGQFFRFAVRKGLVKANPFEGVGGSVKSNKARMFFLTAEDSMKILEACPDAEWRLIFALSRFGGLRTPSEHNALRWADINWEAGKFLVHSPKTEHHEGGESRWVPIFPELRPYLEAVFHDPEAAGEFVINRYRNQANLRTRFRKIIKRAGLKPWPKLFQNLRSTRQTELAKRFPLHLVCAWIGNKAAIAQEHYLQVTDADFERAAAAPTENGTDFSTSDFSIRQQSTANANWNSANTRETSNVVAFGVGGEGLEPATSTV